MDELKKSIEKRSIKFFEEINEEKNEILEYLKTAVTNTLREKSSKMLIDNTIIEHPGMTTNDAIDKAIEDLDVIKKDTSTPDEEKDLLEQKERLLETAKIIHTEKMNNLTPVKIINIIINNITVDELNKKIINLNSFLSVDEKAYVDTYDSQSDNNLLNTFISKLTIFLNKLITRMKHVVKDKDYRNIEDRTKNVSIIILSTKFSPNNLPIFLNNVNF